MAHGRSAFRACVHIKAAALGLRRAGDTQFDAVVGGGLDRLPSRAIPIDTLAGTIKASRVCKQAHQQLKEELGYDHFEGRSWTGLHRHAPMTCIACTYLQHLRLAELYRTGRGKNDDPPSGAAAITQPARRAAGHLGQLFAGVVPPVLCPHRRRRFTPPSNIKMPR